MLFTGCSLQNKQVGWGLFLQPCSPWMRPRQGVQPFAPRRAAPRPRAPESPPLRGPAKGPGSAASVGGGGRGPWIIREMGRFSCPQKDPWPGLDPGALHERAEGEARRRYTDGPCGLRGGSKQARQPLHIPTGGSRRAHSREWGHASGGEP